MSQLDKLLEFVEREFNAHAIYVWGAAGQRGITEAWIRKMEASTGSYSGGQSYAEAAVSYWKAQVAQGYTDMAAYDCSGFVSKALQYADAWNSRRDCDGIWANCTRISEPENGALLFRVASTDSENETHVGIYFNGYQYHAKGRAYGVVKEKYKGSYWHKIGWFKKLERGDTPAPTPTNLRFTHALSSGCKCPDVAKLKQLLIAAGYSGVTASNQNFASATKSTVKRFQTASGITADGVAAKDTIVALGGEWVGDD